MISAVISTFNAAPTLAATLAPLVQGVVHNLVREVVIADAGSTDETLEIAEDCGARVVAGGVEAAIAAAKGPWVLLLQPGWRLSPEWAAAARDHIEHHAGWAGAFRPALDDHRLSARLKEAVWALAPPRTAPVLLAPKSAYDTRGRRVRPLPARVFRIG